MSSTINVLYISYDGMTDPLGQSQVIPYLAGLSKEGYNFTILSCEKKSKYEQNRELITRILLENSIDWEPIFYTKNPPVLSTIYDFKRLEKKAFSLHQQKQFKIVHCRSYISSLIGLKMKLKLDTKFIFDMRGFWADERVDGKLWNLKNPVFLQVYNFFKRAEQNFLLNADSIVSLTERGKQEILNWTVMKQVKTDISVIPCCADTLLFNPEKVDKTSQARLRNELRIGKDDFVLGYLGSIGTWYMLSEMLDFFKELKNWNPTSKFIFITFDEHEKIFELARSKNIPASDIIIRPASRKEVPLLLSVLNFSIFFIRPTYSKMSSSPTKQGEIMAMGVPVICNDGVGDVDHIVEKYQSGIIVRSFNYKEAIEKLIDFRNDHTAIRNYAVEYFSLTNGVKKYLTIYQSLMKPLLV